MERIKIDASLDLRDVVCPLNFVKTKLALEELEPGQVLEVTLDDGEPMRNVPRSVKDEEHTIVSVEKVESAFKLLIKRS